MLKDKIMRILSSGEFLSGEKMALSLGVSRNAVWKAVNSLREEGYPVESIKGKGYHLKDTHRILKKSGISWYSGFPEENIVILKEIPGTNDWVRDNFFELPSPAVVITQSQTKGRGRFGRSFFSPDGQGIYMSLFFREPKIEMRELITVYAALAAADTLRELGIHAEIKWVNDIYIGGKKAGGILTEAELNLDYQNISYLTCGIGLNVYTREFPGELKDKATSLFLSDGREPDINLHAGRLAGKIREYTELLSHDNFSEELHREFMERYNSMLLFKGEEVLFRSSAGEEKGIVRGTDKDGSLILEKEDGKKISLRSGEFSAVMEK